MATAAPVSAAMSVYTERLDLVMYSWTCVYHSTLDSTLLITIAYPI